MKTKLLLIFCVFFTANSFGQTKTKESAAFDRSNSLQDNDALIVQLDTIYDADQIYRIQVGELQKKYAWDSKEVQDMWKKIRQIDSLNTTKVSRILDERGWLGADVIGTRGNETLFLVIQHSDQATQEKYLPMMREAVKKGNAEGRSLALLEDRVAMGQGKKQIYGSQLQKNPKTNVWFVYPLEDPDNVDKRRAGVGLGPIAEYVTHFNVKWDVVQYKKELPQLEKMLNLKR